MSGRSNNLVSFPSLASSLSKLPQATSFDNVSLHPSMYAQHAAESEAKLKKALSKTAASMPYNSSMPPYMPPPYGGPDSSTEPPLMMRKSQKPKFHA
ncbi:hypothetical protein BU15DRAFT_75993 [Melanogaster broomeanus]|nr:hypothetical protein BU15DRAFT_75993 [Melanogaster broomeanus]